jgi:hypothetical protein
MGVVKMEHRDLGLEVVDIDAVAANEVLHNIIDIENVPIINAAARGIAGIVRHSQVLRSSYRNFFHFVLKILYRETLLTLQYKK